MTRTALKWDPVKQDYKPYKLPQLASSFENHLDTYVQCAECGKLIQYGEGYTSRLVHTAMGMGYAVCEKCYVDELDEEKDASSN